MKSIIFACVLSLTYASLAFAQTPKGGEAKPPVSRPAPPASYQPDTLLISPGKGADQEEIDAILAEMHATVVGTIGQGNMKLLVIRTEKGKMAEAEKKLSKDKHFTGVIRNYMFSTQGSTPNRPTTTNTTSTTKTTPKKHSAKQAARRLKRSAIRKRVTSVKRTQAAKRKSKAVKSKVVKSSAPNSKAPKSTAVLRAKPSSTKAQIRTTPSKTSTWVPNDTGWPAEWHLRVIGAVQCWEYLKSFSRHSNVTVAVIDTGVSNLNKDLKPMNPGCNVIFPTDPQYGSVFSDDREGHGTTVATTLAAITGNKIGTASLGSDVTIYPIKATESGTNISLASILQGIVVAEQNNIKIINISSNAMPPNTIADVAYSNPIINSYFRQFHDDYGGLIFNASGNSGQVDFAPINPYLIVVSAIGPDLQTAKWNDNPKEPGAVIGPCVWFTCPGTGITCSGMRGEIAACNGTSFASPICASIAAFYWDWFPNLSNTDIEQLMIASCAAHPRLGGSTYGMPNAYNQLASASALAQRRR